MCGAERCRWKDVHMPPAYPREFREDVIRVAQNREPGVRLVDIAKDFGISESSLNGWLKDADVEDGIKPGATSDERAENRELRKRLRLLEQENEVLRRAAAYLSQANLPKKGSTVGAVGGSACARRLISRFPSCQGTAARSRRRARQQGTSIDPGVHSRGRDHRGGGCRWAGTADSSGSCPLQGPAAGPVRALW